MPPVATPFFSLPDVQVKEQLKIQVTPKGTTNSGTTTKPSDKRDSSKITGILRGNNTSTGQHSIPESPFAACEIVTPRYKTERPTSNGEHSHWASPLAAVEEQSNNLGIKQKSK